jgi:hypothetical protein
VGVLKNDGDPNGLPLTATKVSEAARGTVTLNPDGSFTYSPDNPASQLTDEFEYKATNGTIDSNVARVRIKVDLGENPDLPRDDDYETDEDETLVVPAASGVLDNDPGQPTLAASLHTPPAHGTVVLNADGGFTYKPNLNYFGLDTFVYTATRTPSGNVVGTATVTIEIKPVNDTPNVQAATFTVQEHAPNGTVVGTVNVTDPDQGDDHTWSIVGGNTGGAFAINPNTGTITVANSSAITFTPPGTTFSLQVRTQDNGQPSKSNTDIVTIHVVNAADAPTAVNDTATVAEDGSLTVPPPGVLGNDSDPDGDPMTAVLVSTTSNGTLNLNPATGGYTYTPNPNFFGTDTFTYRASDGTNQSNLATVTITVTAVNDAPSFTAGPSPITVNEDSGAFSGPWATGISAGPGETQGLTFNITNPNPALFSVQPSIDSSTGVLTFTPAANANGSVSLTITLSDDGTPVMTSGPATLVINITADNDAPALVAGGGSPSFTEDGAPVVVDPAIAVSDIDDANLESAVVTITNLLDGASETLAANTGGTAIVASYLSGVLTLTGSDTLANYQTVLRSVAYSNTAQNPNTTARSISFVVNDGDVNSNIVSTNVTITAVNDAPALTAGGILNYTENQAPTAIDGTITVTDFDSATLTGATAQITGGYVNGEDVLSYVNALGITGSFNAATGTLTLTGMASVADYQTALRNVLYSNTSENSSAAARTIAWQVNDGAGANNLSNTPTSTVNMVAVNDAPVVNAAAGLGYTEGTGAVAIDGALTVSDVDDTQLSGATVQITANYVNGQDVLGFVNAFGITGVFNPVTGTLTLSGTTSIANYQSALRTVTYQNTSQNPPVAPRTVTWTVNDMAPLGGSDTTTITITPVNSAPAITAGGTLNYTENQAPTAIDGTITVTDVDSPTIAGATVQITGNYANGEDVLSYVTALGITGSFNAATGTLTLSGTASIADYQTALRNVLYNNTSDNPTTSARTVTWQVNDGGGTNNLSNTATSTVNVSAVNDAPVVNAAASLPYTEGTGAQVIDNALTVTDVDDTQISGATVQITANYVSGEDILGFTNAFGITGSFNAGTGTLTLSGTASIADYQSALRTITYQNTSTNPSVAPRTATWTVNDMAPLGGSDTTTINVTPVNSPPAITAGGTLNYTENDPATVIDNTITVTDSDTANLVGATVQITGNYVNGEDVLSYVPALGITGVFNAATGTLTLTGTTTPANWQTALRNVLYTNTSNNPATAVRTVSWQVDDGEPVDNLSNIATSTVNVAAVNDPPTISTATSINYTEDDGAVAIDNALTVADLDDTNLVGATVQITGNYVNGEDVLAFTNAFGITGVFNAGTGTLTLSGTTSVANYESALRTVTYQNSSQNPSIAARTVTWTVNDAASSGSDTTTINVSAVNDAPVLSITGVISYNEGDPATNAATAANITDDDDTNIESATIQITANYANGQDVLSYTTALGITGNFVAATGTLTLTGSAPLADYITALQNVQYTNASENPSTATRTLTWTVNDGDTNSNSPTSTIAVSETNDAPALVAGGGSPSFTEDGAPVAIDPAIAVSDVDDANLESAVVTITNLLDGASETLAANTGGTAITANYLNGVLTFSGSDTVANYQTVLRSVTYANASQNPNTTARSISFVVNDGDVNSNTVSKNVTVLALNDAPMLTVAASPTPTFTEGGAAVNLATSATIIDVDDTNIESATIQITGNYANGQDVLSYTTALGITGNFVAATGTLTLTGSASLADYATALQNVQFSNTSNNPSALQRTVTWTVNDGTTNSNPQTTNIDVVNVNDSPTINANDLLYSEGAGAVAIDATLTVADTDDTTLPSATVQITANYVNGEDVLGFVNNFGITGSFNAATGTLTLTGPASPANFQNALRTVTYLNTSDTPSTAPRTVTWTVTDGQAATGTDTTTITVTATNDAPVLTVTGTLNYTENDPVTNAATTVNITDADDTNIESATIQITGNYQNGQDVLSYVNALGITGSFNAATGTLTLTGSASKADYITALQNVKYNNTSENPSTLARTVTWTVNDGDVNSNSPTTTINVTAVNDAPVVTPTATPLAYTEDDPATSIQPAITVTDVDSTNLTGATIQITGNYQNGQDVLSYVNALGITGSFNAATGTLTLTGTTTVANYQTALRNVKYNNTSQTPSQLARTVSWQVNDGAGVNNLSTVVNSTINVTAVNDAPTVLNESFDVIGNTELRVDMVANNATPNTTETTPGATSYEGVLDNESDVEGDTVTITAIGNGCSDAAPPFDCTLSSGAVVHVDANGEFSFTPGPGDTTDSFQYTVTDQPSVGTPQSVVGTVTFNFNQMVWYVRQGASGNGTSSAPFGNFDSLDGVGGAGDVDDDADYIFVHNTGSPLAVTVTVPLETNQRVLGEGVGLSIPVSLNGNGSPTNLVTAGTRPVLTLAAGDLFSVGNGIPVEVRGLSMTAGGGNIFTLDSNGALSGSPSLTISENTIGGAGTEGIDVNMNAGTTGTLALTIANNQWNTGGTHTGTAIDVARTAGTLNLDISNNSNVLSTGGTAINVNGAVTITGFGNNTVHQNTVGAGVTITNATFDATPTGAFQTVAGGTMTIGVSGNGVGTSGMTLSNVAGDLAFTDLDVFADNGSGLTITGTGAVNVGGGTGTRVTIGAGVGIVEAVNGPAVSVNNATVDLQLSSLKSTNTTSKGVSLISVADGATAAMFSAGSSSTITTTAGAAGPAFEVSGGNAGISYAGTIANNGTGRAVFVDSWAGSNVATDNMLFSGAIDENGAGILLNNNSGTRSITFSGGLDIDTTTGEGFGATTNTNALGVSVTGTNDITAVSATALRVTNTVIGTGNLNFRNVSSGNNTAAADPANGIVLTNTGSLGRTIISGTGTVNSGGVIQNTTGTGIVLSNTRNVSLNWMQLTNTGAYGISGASMSDITSGAQPTFNLANSRLTSPGDAVNEAALYFGNAASPGNNTGTFNVTNTIVEQFTDFGFQAHNTTGSMTVNITGTPVGLTDSSTKFDDNDDTNGSNAVLVEAAATASITVNVTGVYFNNVEATAISLRSNAASSFIDANLTNNIVRNGGGPDDFPSGGGIEMISDIGGDMNFDIINNNIRDSRGDGIVIIAEGTTNGRINNNVISGTGAGDGIRLDTEQLVAGGGNNFTVTIEMLNNQIGNDATFPGIADDGIQILHRDGTKTLNLTIEGNTIANTSAANAGEGIRYFQDADVSDGALKPYGAVRVVNNTFSTIGTTDALVFSIQDTADLDLHVSGNTLNGANRNIFLQQAGTSVLQITQASVAALAAANTGSTASSLGTITFNSPVTNPPLPTHP